MWQPHAEYRALGQTSHSRQLAYRNLFENQMASNLITDIRQAITQDWYSETTGSGKKLNSLPAKGNATSNVDQSPKPNLRRSFYSDPKYSTRLQIAVTRGSGEFVLNGQQALDIHSAIAAFTINGASLGGHAADLGTIETGKIADLIVLGQNIVELAESGLADRIGETKVRMTVFDGRIVFERN